MRNKKKVFQMFRNKILLVLLVYSVLFLQSCDNFITDSEKDTIRGTGRNVTTVLDLQGFEAVQVNTFANVFITQADNFSVTCTIDEEAAQFVDIYIQSGNLFIDIERDKYYSGVDYIVNISMPFIEELSANSAGNIVVENQIVADNLRLETNSAGNISTSVNTTNLTTIISSAGNVVLSGFAQNHNAYLQSAGNLSAFDLETTNTTISLSSAGNANVYVTDFLQATLSSAGSLYYKGNPRVQSHVSSVGSINHIQ